MLATLLGKVCPATSSTVPTLSVSRFIKSGGTRLLSTRASHTLQVFPRSQWAVNSRHSAGRSLVTGIYNRNLQHRLSVCYPIRHYCSHLQDIVMAPPTSNENPDQYRLPTDVKPLHYDVVIKTDLEALTFQGVVKVRYVVAIASCLARTEHGAPSPKALMLFAAPVLSPSTARLSNLPMCELPSSSLIQWF